MKIRPPTLFYESDHPTSNERLSISVLFPSPPFEEGVKFTYKLARFNFEVNPYFLYFYEYS